MRAPDGTLQIGKGTGSVERFIQAYTAGVLSNRGGAQKAWITLGLFWNPPARRNAPVVAACHCSIDKGLPVRLLDLPTRDTKIHIGPVYKKAEQRLWLEAGGDFDPDETFNSLLDSVDEALGSEPSTAV